MNLRNVFRRLKSNHPECLIKLNFRKSKSGDLDHIGDVLKKIMTKSKKKEHLPLQFKAEKKLGIRKGVHTFVNHLVKFNDEADKG